MEQDGGRTDEQIKPGHAMNMVVDATPDSVNFMDGWMNDSGALQTPYTCILTMACKPDRRTFSCLYTCCGLRFSVTINSHHHT